MDYTASALPDESLESATGPLLLDFGTDWCGWCRRARPLVDAALAGHPQLRHLRVEDGPSRRLGRRFAIKLWPTLVLLADGSEAGRLVRPGSREEIEEWLAATLPRT